MESWLSGALLPGLGVFSAGRPASTSPMGRTRWPVEGWSALPAAPALSVWQEEQVN